ncbi:mediator of RNA polymerase II transcription subunit 27 isoform X4 [Dermacentor andersoni]|uniref:mediator of RNA polymerase II transcription subunit 27 isoform X4 n=1 Tax=Dermacentor andersoni TaxID=34620 RepID=UPI00241807A3|nr:mediator of RNA polymerase II transcription subunit 27-like isoform X4 [Dermacentor andersoni]
MNPYIADIGINLDAVNSGLRAVKALRCTVGEVFRTLTDGVPCSQGDENKEKNFILELQGTLGAVISRIRELETAVTLLGSPIAPLNLGSTGHLCQDPTLDRTSLYTDMIKSYRWFDKVHEHTSHASAILTQNGLKRSNSSLFPPKRLRRPHSNGHNFSPQNVDAFISSVQRQFVDMSIEILRPCGNSAVLKVRLISSAVKTSLKKSMGRTKCFVLWSTSPTLTPGFCLGKNCTLFTAADYTEPDLESTGVSSWPDHRMGAGEGI